MKYASLIVFAAVSLFVQPVFSQQTLLLKQPSISADKLAFVYAGDIWVANRDGSNPRRLTSSPAEENSPVFSPDGTQIAFKANYENNTDAYIIPASGGQPQRLTWHPGTDHVRGWTPDGQGILFASGRTSTPCDDPKLWTISRDGGFPRALPVPRARRGLQQHLPRLAGRHRLLPE